MKTFAKKAGFSLMELVIVMVIIGILSAIGVPLYNRSVETSRAESASATLRMVATAARMFRMNTGVAAAGVLSNACNVAPPTPCNDGTVCALVYCRTLAAQNWDGMPYQFTVQDPAANAGVIALANRDATAPRPAIPAFAAGWGYTITDAGVINPVGTTPAAPQ